MACGVRLTTDAVSKKFFKSNRYLLFQDGGPSESPDGTQIASFS